MSKLQKSENGFFNKNSWSLKKFKKLLKQDKRDKKLTRRSKMFDFSFRNVRYVTLKGYFDYYLSDLIFKIKEKRGYECGRAFKKIKHTITKKDGTYINERLNVIMDYIERIKFIEFDKGYTFSLINFSHLYPAYEDYVDKYCCMLHLEKQSKRFTIRYYFTKQK